MNNNKPWRCKALTSSRQCAQELLNQLEGVDVLSLSDKDAEERFSDAQKYLVKTTEHMEKLRKERIW